MPDRRNHTIRRPSIIVMVLGMATLSAVPSAGLLSGPAPVTSAPAASGHTPLIPAERALRDPGTESFRINPVAFRLPTEPGSPAAPASAPASTIPDLPRVTTTAKPGTAAAAAIDFALAQRGLPYVWGGNGPQRGDAGFDCSGLTTAAYSYAGIDLPRTAHTQYYAGQHVPAGAELEHGDLVFYGVPQRVHHVGLYIGDGRMVAAPTFGKPVRLTYVRYSGDDYLGATRPAAGRDAGELDDGLLATPDLPVEVPPVPSPDVPPAPEEFAAPEVPAETIPAETIPAENIPAGDATGEPAGDALALAEGEPAPRDSTEGNAEGEPDQDPATQAPQGDGTSSAESAAPESAAPESAAPESAAPESAAPDTTAPDTTEATPTDAPDATAPGTPPTALTLPGGAEVVLSGAERDERGLPVAPSEPGTGALRFSPAEDGKAARVTVSLHPGTDTGALDTGSVVVLRHEDGSTVELTVRSTDSVHPDTAADLASGRGDTTRLVLLMADPDTGEVLVVIAERGRGPGRV